MFEEKISILAVDDEELNLDLIEAAFIEYDNVEIINAINGQDALEILKTQEFNVILLDINMPIMNGVEVLQEIRKHEHLHNLPVLMVTASIDKEHEVLKLGASDFIQKPYDIDILCSRTINYAKMNYYYRKVVNQNEFLEEQVQQRTKELTEALRMAKRTEYEISLSLGRASEFRDLETGGHIKRMSHYSQLLAKLYGLSDEECELILYAAPLHDIGKVAISDNILLKPGKLDEEEFNIMKKHVTFGASMLEGKDEFPVLKAGRIIALEHHEKYDGSGYPNGKSAEDIHLYARIVAIADVFDALSSKRCYKEAFPLEKTLEIMKEETGTHFDPTLMELFFKNLDQFLEIKERYIDQ